MINRFLETGRYIKPELVTKYGGSISSTYEALKNRSELVDGFSKWNNDVPLGCRPKLIEYSGSLNARNNSPHSQLCAENRFCNSGFLPTD